MAEFTLDTSGYVKKPGREGSPWADDKWTWSTLDPFTQGYVRRALEDNAPEINATINARCLDLGEDRPPVAFSDLAPETLAAMMKDCAAYLALHSVPETAANYSSLGRDFWHDRQSGRCPAFPPLTLYLGDDGKVYQREAGDVQA